MLTLKSLNLYDLKNKNKKVDHSSSNKILLPRCLTPHNKRKLKINNWILFYKNDIDKIIEEFQDMLLNKMTMSKYFDDIYYISFYLEDIKNDFLTLIFNSSDNSYKNDINYKHNYLLEVL